MKLSEAELCTRFSDAAREDGWTVYPETSGWDLLLVDDDGVQVGIDAKARASFEVLMQCLDRCPDGTHPSSRVTKAEPVPQNFPDVGWEAERDAIWVQEKAGEVTP